MESASGGDVRSHLDPPSGSVGSTTDSVTNRSDVVVSVAGGGGHGFSDVVGAGDVLAGSRELLIPLYSLIFVLGLVGNTLVVITLTRNRHTLNVTNLYLLNLSVSDLLLGVFCMPFTLVGSLLREFIFGELMCKIVPFVQAVSVSVSVWTLVAISLERYCAICRPLHSRRWQTISHALRIVVCLWFLSVLLMLPIVTLSRLVPTKTTGRYKCREQWPSEELEKFFTLFLDVLLLLAPLLLMSLAYSRITYCLWHGIRVQRQNTDRASVDATEVPPHSRHWSADSLSVPYGTRSSATLTVRWNSSGSTNVLANINGAQQHQHHQQERNHYQMDHLSPLPQSLKGATVEEQHRNSTSIPTASRLIRRTNPEQNLTSKRRAVRMLFVLVMEFFVCWTPLYVVNTLSLLDPDAVYGGLGPTGISYFHLIAYCSSCCNPITYCFMNNKFRHGFVQAFSCFRRSKRRRPPRCTGTNGATNACAATEF